MFFCFEHKRLLTFNFGYDLLKQELECVELNSGDILEENLV